MCLVFVLLLFLLPFFAGEEEGSVTNLVTAEDFALYEFIAQVVKLLDERTDDGFSSVGIVFGGKVCFERVDHL